MPPHAFNKNWNFRIYSLTWDLWYQLIFKVLIEYGLAHIHNKHNTSRIYSLERYKMIKHSAQNEMWRFLSFWLMLKHAKRALVGVISITKTLFTQGKKGWLRFCEQNFMGHKNRKYGTPKKKRIYYVFNSNSNWTYNQKKLKLHVVMSW